MSAMSRYIKKCTFLLFLLVSFVQVQGQTGKQPVEVTKRKALVGPYCMVNGVSTVVNAVTNYDHLEYITDSDLNNYASITGIRVGLGVEPILSVKDTKNVYEGGTTAGFSLVSTEGGGLLSLDVIKLFSIQTYLNGNEQENIPVKEASSGGVGLNLIKIPGSDAVSVDVCVETTMDFDEIYLMQGGVQVEAINQLSIRYAFVGDAKEVLLTYEGLAEYSEEIDKTVEIDYDKCHGMPWPVKDKPIREDTFHDKLFDADTTNYLGTGGIAIGEWFHAQIGTTYEFPAGTEVGFKYFKEGLLDLTLGSFVTIKLYDEHNNVVQTENISVGILGLGVVNAGETITSITSKVPFYSARLTVGAGALSVNLGGTGIYYGFIREKPEVYHYCPIEPSMSATICKNVTTYELKSNPTVKVEWKLTGFEHLNQDNPQSVDDVIKAVQIGESVNGVAKVTGLIANGTYTFKATATDCTAETKCSETITLTKGTQIADTSCGQPVVNKDGEEDKYELSTSTYGVTGGLISISDIKDKANILDGEYNNYASYVSGLSVASNLGIIGIKTKDGQPFDLGIEGDKRVGFIVENASTFLDADVLQFLRIRLFRNGKVVDESVIDESNAIGVGLIGSEQSQKVRYSIKVPSDVEFDEYQLWTSGVLNLGLNTLRIYYAFMESADENCSDPLNCALTVSTEATNASLSLQIPFQTASIAGTLVKGDLLLDGDMNTALTYTPAVGIGTGMVLCVKPGRTVDKSQQLGLALDSKTFALGAGVGSWITVSTYLDGQATGEEFSDWNTVGLDVIGYGDRRYLISQPTLPYDEVRITFAAVVSALEGYNLYGLFFRSDIDGDGLPDCMDPESCAGSLSKLQTTPHICEGEKVMLYGQAKFEEEKEKTYKISIFKKDDDINTANPVVSKADVVIQKGNFQKEIWTETKAGEYVLVIYDKDEDGNYIVLSQLYFTVHPLETTWSGTTTGTDWNAWNNWTKGSPWNCTNVIIPESAAAYPVLDGEASNGCNYIHFEPNAEVRNTHYLDYEKAWVDIKLKPNRYYMLAAPLKRIYSGDWFIAAEEKQQSGLFTPLTAEAYPENRVTPTIYQRVWDAVYMDQLINSSNRPYIKPGDKVDISVTGWTKPFNWLATPYDKNDIFDFNSLSVWVHPLKPSEEGEGDSNKEYTFRFPKAHDEYHYYDENGTVLGLGVQIKDRKNSGRFIYENEDGKTKFPVVMRFKNDTYDNKTFLVGNPFMTHIDVNKFLDGNGHIASVKVYDWNNGTTNSLIHNLDGDGILAATPAGGANTLTAIAPMQSFFVTCAGDALMEFCEVTFTEDMLVTKPEMTNGRNRVEGNETVRLASRYMRLAASADSCRSGALVYFSAKANDHYRESEDAEILLEGEMGPAIVLFTIAEQHALDIQQRANGGEIPLGMYMDKPADVTLSVTVPEEFSGWSLKDLDNDKIYPLLAGKENKIELGRLTTNVGRFCLKGEFTPTSNGHIAATQPEVFCYREEGGGSVVVRSAHEPMVRCEVFAIDGRRMGLMQAESTEYRLPLAKGIHVVKVYFRDGISAVVKVL